MSRRSVAALTAGCVVLLGGCTGTEPPTPSPAGAGPARPISVRADDAACDLSTVQAPAGTLTFAVTNTGNGFTGFYLYGTGDRILGEIENIGPGLTRQLVVDVPDGGVYTTACRPGMGGDGIRAPFTVTGTATRTADITAKLAGASADYRRYVVAQTAALVPKTQEFADAVKAGNVDGAKNLFPVARTYYERIEWLVESFPGVDTRIDGKEDDPRAPGAGWTGFHRLEKDLWVDGLRPDSAQVAEQLVTDVKDLQMRTVSLQLKPDQLAIGAKELLDAVAVGKIAGEEDRYSHTDLWDLWANVDGSRAAVAALRPVIDEKDPTLGPVLDARFAAVDLVVQQYRVGNGFRTYTELTHDDIKKLTDAIDALSEPTSKMTGVVTS